MCCLLCWSWPAQSVSSADLTLSKRSAAVVVSRKIRPYLSALEGVTATLEDEKHLKTDIFYLSDYSASNQALLIDEISKKNYQIIVSIGPEASQLLSSLPVSDSFPILVHSMVFNPEKILGEQACGVFLNIPAYLQIEAIKYTLSSVDKIGVLYNPELNSEFINLATFHAEQLETQLVPMEIGSKKELSSVLKQHWNEIDVLWFIPDQTIISESIIKYIIKEAFIHNKPTVGYNRFFSESGSLMSFVFDYKTLGSQAAQLALKRSKGAPCEQEIPQFDIHINTRVSEKLSIPVRTPPAKEDEK